MLCLRFFGGVGNSFATGFRLYCGHNRRKENTHHPAILDEDTFHAVQAKIRAKTEGYTYKEKRPALKLKDHLRCTCGGALQRVGGTTRRKDTLYLKCAACGTHVTILDEALLAEVSRQVAEYSAPKEQPYVPDSEVIRLTNAINRGLEHLSAPEDVSVQTDSGLK